MTQRHSVGVRKFFGQHIDVNVKYCYLKSYFFFFQLLYLESGFLSVAYLTVANLARLEISVHCQVSFRSSIQSGSSPSAGLQVVTQSTHLSRDCYPLLVSNLHHSEIRPPKQLDYRCMPLHPTKESLLSQFVTIDQALFLIFLPFNYVVTGFFVNFWHPVWFKTEILLLFFLIAHNLS